MTIINYIKDILGLNLKRSLENLGEDLLHLAYSSIRRIEKRIINELYALIFIASATILFAISATFFFIEYLNVNKTLSTLIIAIILLLIGIIFKIKR